MFHHIVSLYFLRDKEVEPFFDAPNARLYCIVVCAFVYYADKERFESPQGHDDNFHRYQSNTWRGYQIKADLIASLIK